MAKKEDKQSGSGTGQQSAQVPQHKRLAQGSQLPANKTGSGVQNKI